MASCIIRDKVGTNTLEAINQNRRPYEQAVQVIIDEFFFNVLLKQSWLNLIINLLLERAS